MFLIQPPKFVYLLGMYGCINFKPCGWRHGAFLFLLYRQSKREIKKAPRFLCLEDDGLSLSRKFLASKDWPRLGAVSGKFLWSQLLGLVTWEFFMVNKSDLLGDIGQDAPHDSYWPLLLTLPNTLPRSRNSTLPRSCHWRFLGAVFNPA